MVVRRKDRLVIEMSIGTAMGEKLIFSNLISLDRSPVGVHDLVRHLRQNTLPRQRPLEATDNQHHWEQDIYICSHDGFHITQSLTADSEERLSKI
jgi:hypothetical protein